MAYKAKDQFFPVVVEGNVKTTGGSLNLAVGQIAVVDINSTSSNGAKVLSDFSNLSPSAKLAIRMGEPKDNVSRSEDNKAISTIPFKIKDVTNIYVDAPEREGVKVDDFIIGYNGVDGSEIDLDNGQNETIELCLKGDLMGMIGLPDSKHVIQVDLTAPIDGVKNSTLDPGDGSYDASQWTMEEIIEKAFIQLKNRKLPGNIPLTDFVDVMLVNSNNPALPGTPRTFYNLLVEDEGTETALGKVQAQYSDLEITKVKWVEGVSTYVAAASSLPAAYQEKSDFILKGCDSCPAGYTELDEGFVYEITLENDGADETATVQAIPGAVASSAVLNEIVGDKAFYSVITDDALTEAEIDAFLTANVTATVTLVSEDLAALCQSPAPASIAWVEGETCNFDTETYTIRLADTECGSSRLAELQAAYPDLTITEVAASNTLCQRTYQTTVNTNLVCEECSDEFRDIFESEAPDFFDSVSWEKAEKQYSGTSKMGIRVRGKRSQLSGNEFLRDTMFHYDDSVEISLVGGFPTHTNESYLAGGTNGRFAVKYLSRKAKPQNQGGNLRKYEEEAQMHFRGRKRYTLNNYAKIVNGQETRFDGLSQYITYSVTIAPLHVSNHFEQPQNGAFTYHFPVALGKQGDIEDVLNKLAAAAGLPSVKAISE